MLKNSKGIILFSLFCYACGLVSAGFLIYELVKVNWNFSQNLNLFIALIVSAVVFLLIAFVLNPPKVLNSNTLNFVSGLLLYACAGVALAFVIYTCVKNYELSTLLLCVAIIIACVYFGTVFLKVAKQDINVKAKKQQEQKQLEKQEKQTFKSLEKCPYCGCKLSNSEEVCPNCKSNLKG